MSAGSPSGDNLAGYHSNLVKKGKEPPEAPKRDGGELW
jgi:hypothetical protein